MDKFFPLLKYLETVNSKTDFVLRGHISVDKTPLEHLKGLAKISNPSFSISFRSANEMVAISKEWADANGIVFDTISWFENVWSGVHIYLSTDVRNIHIKSSDTVFINKVDEYANQIEFRTICAN